MRRLDFSVTLADVANEQPSIVAELANVDRLTAVSTFASMLATPLLQANAYRLEALVHIAAIQADGRQHPSLALIRRAFKSLAPGYADVLEDPAEDLFTASVHCTLGKPG